MSPERERPFPTKRLKGGFSARESRNIKRLTQDMGSVINSPVGGVQHHHKLLSSKAERRAARIEASKEFASKRGAVFDFEGKRFEIEDVLPSGRVRCRRLGSEGKWRNFDPRHIPSDSLEMPKKLPDNWKDEPL